MDGPLQLGRGVEIPQSEVELRTSRSSGPGGQHANVTASRIEAVFHVEASPTLSDDQKRRIRERAGATVTAVAQDARSQARNRELALQPLPYMRARARPRPPRRPPTRPGRAAKERRLTEKKQRSQRKAQRRRPGDDY
jgi:ribosome-associated protein